MHRASFVHSLARVAIAVLVTAVAVVPYGCTPKASPDSTADATAAGDTGATADETGEPAYSAWQVYVNDEDSYDEGGITYTIALNLTATNASPDVSGTYAGSATAHTSSVGTYEGMELNASAIAESTTLEFELSQDAPLAPLTGSAPADYYGSGSIVMTASGGGTYGPAGGSFFNTSGQNLQVSVAGTDVTLQVTIDDHVYTFQGTLIGQE